MKKMLSILLTVIILLSLSAYADAPAETPDQIQIQFKVGDSILQINGQRVEVQTPYVEDGVTLVPLRVITEAFGAEVLWEDATQKITLTYEGTAIVLQIGNKNATVNGKDQPLLVAPQMVNDKTMVPLRFITETFGAQVSYDEKTEAILVTMQKAPLPTASPVPSEQPTAVPTPTQSPESTAAITISEADEQGYKTYTNKTLGLSFKFPKEYVEAPDSCTINDVVLWKQDKYGVKGMIYFSVFRGGEDSTISKILNNDHIFLSSYEIDSQYKGPYAGYPGYPDYVKTNAFSCSELQSNTDLSGLDTRFFIYTMLNTKIKTMYAVNENYVYNLRFYDDTIDWTAMNTKNINIIKDIHIDKIEDQQQAELANEWPEEEPNTTPKPSYYSSDYSLTLPVTWIKANSAEAYFNHYGAVFAKSKNCVELDHGYVQYINPDKANSFSPIWKDTMQNVTFSHESGIVFNVTQLTMRASYKPIMSDYSTTMLGVFSDIVQEDPCAMDISSVNYKKYLWGMFFQKNPNESPPQFTFYKTNFFNYVYTKDTHTYYNTVYQLPNQGNDLTGTNPSTAYMISVSIPKEAYTPASHVIVDKIINSLNLK